MKLWYKRIFYVLGTLTLSAGAYYVLIARLPLENLSVEAINARYQTDSSFRDFTVVESTAESREFTFTSFDGETVFGRVMYPRHRQAPFPVLIGNHAMGRSYPRWFQDSLKGRPTITHVNKITDAALDKGYAVVAIDARFHGKRKHQGKSLRSIWNDLHFFGDKTEYESMIVNTVRDNRTLIDWIETQDNLDTDDITVAGYSMGGQVSLLLAAVDQRVDKVIAIVPPFVNNSVATVSPLNLVTQIDSASVLYLYGEADDVASPAENRQVFAAITSNRKTLVALDTDHILPVSYVETVSNWLDGRKDSQGATDIGTP